MRYTLPLVFLTAAALLFLDDRGAIPIGICLAMAALSWLVAGESGA